MSGAFFVKINKGFFIFFKNKISVKGKSRKTDLINDMSRCIKIEKKQDLIKLYQEER